MTKPSVYWTCWMPCRHRMPSRSRTTSRLSGSSSRKRPYWLMSRPSGARVSRPLYLRSVRRARTCPVSMSRAVRLLSAWVKITFPRWRTKLLVTPSGAHLSVPTRRQAPPRAEEHSRSRTQASSLDPTVANMSARFPLARCQCVLFILAQVRRDLAGSGSRTATGVRRLQLRDGPGEAVTCRRHYPRRPWGYGGLLRECQG